MIVYTYNINSAGGLLAKVLQRLSGSERSALNEAASKRLLVLCRGHLLSAAASRHSSAQRVGGTKTGHLTQAADSMDRFSDSNIARVTIDSPGFKRVFGPMLIVPDKKPYLTIPINALSYGKWVYEVADSFSVFRPVAKGGKKKHGPYQDFLATSSGGVFTPLYILRKSVKVPQDRGLLPSDAAMQKSVMTGYHEGIKEVLKRS